MPMYMDIHEIPGATAEDVAKAHSADVETQQKYGVEYHKYWFNERSGKIFCLCSAPSPEGAASVHREAHGLLAAKIRSPDQSARYQTARRNGAALKRQIGANPPRGSDISTRESPRASGTWRCAAAIFFALGLSQPIFLRFRGSSFHYFSSFQIQFDGLCIPTYVV